MFPIRTFIQIRGLPCDCYIHSVYYFFFYSGCFSISFAFVYLFRFPHSRTFIFSHPSSVLTQASPGERQSFEMNGISLLLLSIDWILFNAKAEVKFRSNAQNVHNAQKNVNKTKKIKGKQKLTLFRTDC